MADHREIAAAYMHEHRLNDLFENLTASLAFTRPDDPKAHLIEELEKLRAAKEAKTTPEGFFEQKDFGALFGILDVSRSGYITLNDYKTGMGLLGYAGADAESRYGGAAGARPQFYNTMPAGASMGKIGKDTFVK